MKQYYKYLCPNAYFLYNWLKMMKQYFISISSGATFAELTKGSFKRILILTPPKELSLQYQNKVAPLYKKVEGLIQKNNLFKQTRDRLLTRLISGKLSLADLDIRFPRSMREESDAELHP
jgi:type I restriction enzyme S subunit